MFCVPRGVAAALVRQRYIGDVLSETWALTPATSLAHDGHRARRGPRPLHRPQRMTPFQSTLQRPRGAFPSLLSSPFFRDRPPNLPFLIARSRVYRGLLLFLVCGI